jgi:hypothetical protein
MYSIGLQHILVSRRCPAAATTTAATTTTATIQVYDADQCCTLLVYTCIKEVSSWPF